jgi:predicted NAD/FAD-dependent oxidoreductase
MNRTPDIAIVGGPIAGRAAAVTLQYRAAKPAAA